MVFFSQKEETDDTLLDKLTSDSLYKHWWLSTATFIFRFPQRKLIIILWPH